MKLGIFLSGGGDRSVQRPLYDNAWALLNGESASAEKLLSIDFKIQELAAREELPNSSKERLYLLLKSAGSSDSD